MLLDGLQVKGVVVFRLMPRGSAVRTVRTDRRELEVWRENIACPLGMDRLANRSAAGAAMFGWKQQALHDKNFGNHLNSSIALLDPEKQAGIAMLNIKLSRTLDPPIEIHSIAEYCN